MTVLMTVVVVMAMATLTAGATIGIDVGMVSNQLPPVKEIVQLLKSRGVTNVRIYDASASVLSAFANQGIAVSVTNFDVVGMANSQQAATNWVRTYVQPFASVIDRIVVGNEWLHDPKNDPSKLLPAMQNVQTALTSLGLNKRVTTAHAYDIIKSPGYPPSSGTFLNPGVIGSILQFLKRTDSAFMVNIYPYFAYVGNPQININYALGNPGAPSITDNGKTYSNLLDAQLDTVISAMRRAGYGDVPLILGETGWPSAGGPAAASINNAKMYNQNLVRQVLGGKGTPLRPGINIPTYIFALFNENLKSGPDIERNFGLYRPDKTPVYPINLSV